MGPSWLRVSGATLPVLLCLLIVPGARAQRTQFKAGWNLYSPQEDIRLGRQVAVDAEKQLPSCNSPKVDAYLAELGSKLIAKLPTAGVEYPFEFHCVNDKAINAFALPGGFVFVNRGAIEAADNEAQLAGVMAHEIGHVVLRHGTNQVSKAYLAKAPLAVLGGALGGNAAGAVMGSLGGLGLNSLFLHYSREAETQADLM